MRTITILKPGGYDALCLRSDLPIPPLKEHEVRIHVAFAGVNYADCLVRLGLYKSAKDHGGYPLVPGFDFSGVISDVGPSVSRHKVGDCVFGVTLFGGYQTDITAHEDYVCTVPKSISLAQAASLPTAFLTAYYLLHHSAYVRPGERLLVRSIAGGVGGWLGILGTQAGAEVHGTVSTKEKCTYVKSLGYTHVYIEHDIKHVQFDVIANAFGGPTIKEDFARLTHKGRLVLYGFHGMVQTNKSGKLSLTSYVRLVWSYLRTTRIHPFTLVNENRSVSGFNLSYLYEDRTLYRIAMKSLNSLIQNGIYIPPVTEIPMTDVADAHQLLENKKTIGKLVLNMNE